MFDLIISIIVYGLTGLILYSLANSMAILDARSIRITGRHSPMWSIFFLISIAVFAIVSGARYNTGVDHLNYLAQYSAGGEETDEPLFYMISHFLSGMGVHYFFYFALWASIQITFVYLAMKDHREMLPFIALAIMLGPYYLDWMNGIRQTIVECFFLFVVCFFTKEKTKKRFLLCVMLLIIATTIHRSAWILILLLLLSIVKIPMRNKWINITIAFLCIIVGMTPYWINMNSSGVAEVLAILGYDHYSLVYEEMVEMADFQDTAMGPLRILSLLVDLAIIWFYPRMEEFYKSDNTLSSFFLYFMLGVFAYNLFANTNILFLRPIAYLTIFKLPMIGYMLYYLKTTKNSLYSILAVMIFSYAMIDVLKSGLLGVKPFNLYHFFFFS